MKLPNPPVAQPGQLPQAGQWAPYQYENGSLAPAIIDVIGQHSPNDRRYNVSAVVLTETGFIYGEWQFDVASARILWVPPGPPW